MQHSDLMVLLARTTPLFEVEHKTEGMSLFLIDLREAVGPALKTRPIPNMVNHETNELFFENLELPLQSLIGEEGQGLKYIFDGLNAERALIAASASATVAGSSIESRSMPTSAWCSEGPSGRTRAFNFLSPRRCQKSKRRSDALQGLLIVRCAEVPAAPKPKHGAASGHRGFLGSRQCLPRFPWRVGFACEYDVERKFRETRLYQVAPISTNLILSYVADMCWTAAIVLTMENSRATLVSSFPAIGRIAMRKRLPPEPMP